MIKDIRIYSRNEMQDCASGRASFIFQRWYLISIHEGINILDRAIQDIFKNTGCLSALSLNFWDVTEEVFERVKQKHPESSLFNRFQAKRIISFLDNVQKDPQDSVLVANCLAGISRSGAVGTFACDYCGLNYEEFMKNNPYIFSNKYVLKVLRDVSGVKFDEAHDGINRSLDNIQEIIAGRF